LNSCDPFTVSVIEVDVVVGIDDEGFNEAGPAERSLLENLIVPINYI
jgi:hypothetical protein